MRKYTVIPTRVANRHVSRDVTPEQYNVIGGNLLVSLEVHTVHQVKSWRQRRSARGAYGSAVIGEKCVMSTKENWGNFPFDITFFSLAKNGRSITYGLRSSAVSMTWSGAL